VTSGHGLDPDQARSLAQDLAAGRVVVHP
jgi:hypothetical protein